MIKSRVGLTVVAALAVLLSGCAASGGAGGAGGGGGVGVGTPPRDNDFTRSADFFLIQATQADDPGDRYREALVAATNAINDSPNNPLGYFLAGRAQLGLEDYVAADTLFSRALELYSGYREEIRVERENAWINLFNASLDAGDTDEGIGLLEDAEVIFHRQRPEALINLGVFLGNAGRYDEAADSYGAAIEIITGPRIAEVNDTTAADWRARLQSASFNRARVLTLGERYEDAAAAYGTYLEAEPGDIQALTGLAQALVTSGQPDSAQAIYNNLLESPGLGLRTYMEIGVGLYNADVYDQAARAFQAASSISPQNRDAVYNLAQSLFEAEAWDDLIPVAQQLMDLDGNNPQSHLLLGYALARTDREQEAGAVLEASEALAFTIDSYQLQPRTGGGATVGAMLTNRTLEEGTAIEIRVHFSGEDGSEIGTVDVRVDAPPQEQARQVTAEIRSSEIVAGFYFEVLSPR